MNKTTQNLIWNCLPLEVKKEVKRQYQIATNAKEHFTECTLEYLFGSGNLTSDAEGEEMLTCEKSKVIKLYNKFQKDGTFTCLYAAGVLDTLFGSKCLPDGNEDNFASKEPKAAEPEGHIAENHNLSQHCDKSSDNPQSDKNKAGTNHFGDSNEMVNDRRLNIAVMIMGYLIRSGYYALDERYRKENMSEIIKLSLQLTDALIAETKKTSNSN